MKPGLLFFACYVIYVSGNIIYKAKFIDNVKVSGNSDLVYALSVTHCLALCNKASDCDAITYYDELNKCRLFKRCAPVQIVNASSHYWFYAKRPPTFNDGYIYDERSDSCIKITNQQVTYDEADDTCGEEHGYLAVLNTPELRVLATRILKASGNEEAWVSPPTNFEKYAYNKVYRNKPKSGKDEGRTPTHSKQCWALKYDKLVKLPVCNSERKISICQLPTY